MPTYVISDEHTHDDAEPRQIEVAVDGDAMRVDGVELHLDPREVGAIRHASVEGRPVTFGVRRKGREWRITIGGVSYTVEVDDARYARLRRIASAHGVGGPAQLKAPIPGLIVRTMVEVGDEVQKGQPVIVLDAMKLENELAAPGAGTVQAIHVEPGQPVEKGDALLDIA